MGYDIKYEGELIKTPIYPKMGNGMKGITIFVATLCILILLSMAGNTDKFRRWILPGDADVTEKALNELVNDLKHGEDLNDAITAFCQEILDHATTPA